MDNTAKEFEEQLPTYEQIAEDVQAITKAFRAISKTRVSRKLLITLLHASSQVNKRDIEYILNNLEQMDEIWLKSLPKENA